MLVETVKLADDRSGDIVVRLYESRGGRARAIRLAVIPAATAVHETDLLEAARPPNIRSTPAGRDSTLRPFQIRTLRLIAAAETRDLPEGCVPDARPAAAAAARCCAAGPLRRRADGRTRPGASLLAEEGVRDAEIARRLGHVPADRGHMAAPLAERGPARAAAAPPHRRPVTVDEAEVVTRALLAPGGSGAGRAIARELGLSHATVAAIRRRWRLTPDEPDRPFVPTGRRCPAPTSGCWASTPTRAGRAAGRHPTRCPRRAAPAATVIGEDVLTGLGRALDALRGPRAAGAQASAEARRQR